MGQHYSKLTARQRQHAEERASLIAALGMAPEPEGVGPFHPDAYPATNGEMEQWLAEQAAGDTK
jgi:hypothetical protein